MSNGITWAVLTDGRYIRVLYNKGEGKTLLTLKADDNEALANLSFEVVRGVKPGAKNGSASKTKTNMQLLSDFLVEQQAQGQFKQLVIAAPQAVLDELLAELPEQVTSVIAGKLQEDILAKSIDEIEDDLANLVQGS